MVTKNKNLKAQGCNRVAYDHTGSVQVSLGHQLAPDSRYMESFGCHMPRSQQVCGKEFLLPR